MLIQCLHIWKIPYSLLSQQLTNEFQHKLMLVGWEYGLDYEYQEFHGRYLLFEKQWDLRNFLRSVATFSLLIPGRKMERWDLTKLPHYPTTQMEMMYGRVQDLKSALQDKEEVRILDWYFDRICTQCKWSLAVFNGEFECPMLYWWRGPP